MTSYVMWNNKGGVGKSTLTFQLASAYARQHPSTNTYVVDLSPQCDVSRMILGGGVHNGEGTILSLMQQTHRTTIFGYLSACLNSVPSGNGWPLPGNYVVQPNQLRPNRAPSLPSNLSLVCGDFDLERVVQLLQLMAQPPPRGGRVAAGPHYSTFLLTRSFLRHLVDQVCASQTACIFVDTDPYYSVVTTQMGLLSADRWITAYAPGSQASQHAVFRSIDFLHDPLAGLGAELQRQATMYPTPWFDNQGRPLNAPTLRVPGLHSLIANITTPYSSRQQPYSTPQQLHRQTIASMAQQVSSQLAVPSQHHIWDLKRLGLICDYNGIDLQSLSLGQRYPQPNSNAPYPLHQTGGTPIQLAAYQANLNAVAGSL